MEKSESINELLEAMSKAYGGLKNAKEDSNNPHYKSKYASLGEVLNVIRPVASSNGLMFSQVPETIDGELFLITFIGHKSGQWMKSSLKLMLSKMDSQGMGSAITYARRYSLSSWFGIAAGDDDDGNEAAKQESAPIKMAEEPTISLEQFKVISSKASLLPDHVIAKVLSTKGWYSFADMKAKQYNACIKYLDDLIKQELQKEMGTQIEVE